MAGYDDMADAGVTRAAVTEGESGRQRLPLPLPEAHEPYCGRVLLPLEDASEAPAQRHAASERRIPGPAPDSPSAGRSSVLGEPTGHWRQSESRERRVLEAVAGFFGRPAPATRKI